MAGGTKRHQTIRRLLRATIPRAPMADTEVIFEHALAGHLRHLPPSTALWLATTSRVRHAHTDYDALLADGYDPDAARFFVVADMEDVLADWGCSKKIDMEGEEPA
ncbi:DUF2293 domain-containing protein [Breoghania sp.]|uniref:DUF2293 domain-containing protein n=1 Tax=Breoghania sp. TaxID=2065378 RepID=UPI002AA8AC22|nr:DUF2293 domain-containing protein [Breoghania sp.]